MLLLLEGRPPVSVLVATTSMANLSSPMASTRDSSGHERLSALDRQTGSAVSYCQIRRNRLPSGWCAQVGCNVPSAQAVAHPAHFIHWLREKLLLFHAGVDLL